MTKSSEYVLVIVGTLELWLLMLEYIVTEMVWAFLHLVMLYFGVLLVKGFVEVCSVCLERV